MTEVTTVKPPAMTAARRQANRRARLNADAERGRELRYQENSLNVLASEVLKFKRYVTIDLQQIDPARPFHCINDQLVYAKVEALAADLAQGEQDVATNRAKRVARDSLAGARKAVKELKDIGHSLETVPATRVDIQKRKPRSRVGK